MAGPGEQERIAVARGRYFCSDIDVDGASAGRGWAGNEREPAGDRSDQRVEQAARVGARPLASGSAP